MLEKLSNSLYTSKSVKILFLLLLATFPFGANLMPVSLGFMTLYPFLIFLLILFIIGFFKIKIIKSNIEKFYLVFLFGWLVISAVRTFFVENMIHAIVDTRSIGVAFLLSFVIIWVKSFLGFKEWRRVASHAIKSIFFLITICSIIEFLTGIHFLGSHTEKITELPIAGYTYSPVFLFDNPNNLVVYLFLLGGLNLILDKDSVRKPYMNFLILFICLFVAQVNYSRLGTLYCIFYGIVYLILYLPIIKERVRNKGITELRIIFAVVLVLLLSVVYMTNGKYIGPMWSNSTHHNFGTPKNESFILENKNSVSVDSTVLSRNGAENKYALKLEIAKKLDMADLDTTFESHKIRAGLILNGIEFIKERPFLGIGPGQFRQRHIDKEIVYYTKTNISPHNGLIEVVSQFGLIIFIPFLAILFYVIVVCVKSIKTRYFDSVLVINNILLFGVMSLLPSGFIILDINWLFLVFLICFVVNLRNEIEPDTNAK